jgi:hypothetical protein
MLRRLLLAGIAATLATACAPHDDGDVNEPDAPRVDPKPDPEPEQPVPVSEMATVTIASVQIVQDCPDSPDAPAQPTHEKPAMSSQAAPMPPALGDESRAARVARGASADGSAPFRQPCTQSSMQLSFAGQGPEAAKVQIGAVRVLTSTGEKLGTLQARKPTAWRDSGYQPWDEMLPADSDLKASYKLSVPDWSVVESKLGDRNPFETMFVLEVDVEIGGETQTVRSPEFVRERPHVIVT